MDGHTPDAEKAQNDRYYVDTGLGEREVEKSGYVLIERSAGFRSKFGPDEVATSSFSRGSGESRVSGRIVHANGRPLSRGPSDCEDTEQGPMQRKDDLSR
jgi:hypothetical protein